MTMETGNVQGESGMPYARDEDLPPSVRNHLPPHARAIFRNAFKIAHRVAWAPVKKRYQKLGVEWVPR